jgi:hypothetical protein
MRSLEFLLYPPLRVFAAPVETRGEDTFFACEDAFLAGVCTAALEACEPHSAIRAAWESRVQC